MNEQEAQQAQTIADVKRRHNNFQYVNSTHAVLVSAAHEDRGNLLKIVDSQAQKIQDLQNGKTIGSLHHQIATLEVKVAEARKLAEKMRDASERPGGGHTFLPWERKP